MRFSQRLGLQPVKTQLQIDSIDDDLRIGLWNVVDTHYLKKFEPSPRAHLGKIFFQLLYLSFLKLPLDSIDRFYSERCKRLRAWYFGWEWFQVYDFIEFLGQIEMTGFNAAQFRKVCNEVLEKELSGYRFVSAQITPITNDIELNEIEQAIEISQEKKMLGVKTHLTTALAFLSDRKNPDYRNSIKESISSVEAMAQIILGDQKAELGKALKVIEEEIGLHPALKAGFVKIYGYTSDADGIRHAMIQDSKSDFDEAKYMLVSCSAFINYLMMKAVKAGII